MPLYRISRWQLALLVFMASFCMTPFTFAETYQLLGRYQWAASLLQGGVTLVGAMGTVFLLQRRPQESFPQLAQQALGKGLGWIVTVALGLWILLWGAMGNVNVMVAILHDTTLPLTHPYLLSALFVGAGAFAAYYGPEVIGRVAEAWSWIFLPVLGLLIFLPFLYGHLGRLLPLTGVPREVWAPEVWAYALGARGFSLALGLAGQLQEGKRLFGPVVGGSLAAVAAIALLRLAPLTLFFPEVTARFRYPVLEAMDAIRATGLGIQSFLTITMAVWPLVSFLVVAPTLYAGSFLLARALGIRNVSWVLAAAALLCVFLSGQRIAVPLLRKEVLWWSWGGYGLTVILPWIMAWRLPKSSLPSSPSSF
ncbi:MAG: GerAB/ArcD/ProY family transporter [Bacillota bacterium]|nr:GerAB/ArcD/ProY family transporter [Bacillota bacterium]